MAFSTEEILAGIGLVFAAFAFCMNKALKLTRDLVTLTERHESLNEQYEAQKFSLDERMNKIEQGIAEKFQEIKSEITPIRDKVQELDRNTAVNGTKLDTVIKGISKIFELLEKKADKVAV